MPRPYHAEPGVAFVCLHATGAGHPTKTSRKIAPDFSSIGSGSR
jgi:hypothetical protein